MIGSKGTIRRQGYQYVLSGTCIIWRCEIKPKGNGNKIISNGKPQQENKQLG